MESVLKDSAERVPEWAEKSILILGCGNILFGDDGFGSRVAEYIQHTYEIPEHAQVMDVGTGVREILFDIVLSKRRPERVVVVDAVDWGRRSGEVFELSIDDLPARKTDDFSIHQIPSSNLLKELRELCQVDIVLIVCQTGNIPEAVEPGLSEPVRDAVAPAAKMIFEKYLQETQPK